MAISSLDNYYYGEQLRRYIIQFAAIFAGLSVEVGKRDDADPKLIYVPVKNASSDRVVASIKGENTQNKLIRLPIISFQLVNIDMAPELRKGVGVERRNTYMPTGGSFPNDIKVIEQRQPVPYRAVFELAIWASNQNQHYQIIEQILSLFDPILQIQTSDDVFDFTRITSVELSDVGFSENIPYGAERRLIRTTLVFSMPIYLSMPSKVHDKYIQDIFLRIGAVSSSIDAAYDIIADLDAQGVEYEKVFSLKDVDL